MSLGNLNNRYLNCKSSKAGSLGGKQRENHIEHCCQHHNPSSHDPLAKCFVSSCGCVHSTSGGYNNPSEALLKIDINGEELCGGCGCVCGEGHRHFNQKLGTESALICCNAHGLRVNRSRPKNGRRILFCKKNNVKHVNYL